MSRCTTLDCAPGCSSVAKNYNFSVIGRLMVAAFAGLSLLLVSAEVMADKGALAEALFRQGQSLMAEEKFDEACPKFEESQRLEALTGTLLNLAVCHEKQGKLATAWNEFNAALVASRRDRRDDRVAYAKEHIDALEPQLSKLTLVLPESNQTKGLEITLDTTQVGRPAWNIPLPVDPGKHTLLVRAPGKVDWSSEFEVDPGPGRQSISIPSLEDAPAAQSAPPEKGGQDGVSDQGSGTGRTQRIVALAVGGAGIVGLGVGGAFGLQALVLNGKSNKNGCVDDICDDKGTDYRENARAAGRRSNIAFAIGGGLLATGIVLYFTAPKTKVAKKVSGLTATDRYKLSWKAAASGSPYGGQFKLGASW